MDRPTEDLKSELRRVAVEAAERDECRRLDSLIGRKLGGRGKCRHCGEWHNNVAYHEAHQCAANGKDDTPKLSAANESSCPSAGSDFCTWKPDSDGNWETTCGQIHVFFDGTPHQNCYDFCPYCGKQLAQTEGEDHE